MITSQDTASTRIDTVIDERYHVLEQVGKGGMGVVYKVKHVRMGKIAALKILHSRLGAVADVLRRFRVEAEAISKLNHPNIVQVFDYGDLGETPYIVMEYLHGENLGTILHRDGPLPLRRYIPLAAQICDALTEAHALGVIHRDLKPENIQVSRTRAGQDLVKVVDFGLAKVMHTSSPQDSSAGNIVGTPYYMAPEQIRAQIVDPRVDIYALGAVTYRVLTGNQAFTANSPLGVLTKHITEDLVAPSKSAPPELKLSRAIDSVVTRAMAKSPADRFASAAEMKTALLAAATKALSSEVAVTPPPAVPRRWSDVPDDVPDEPSSVDLTPVSHVRLTRADLAFERKLRRGRGLRLLALLLLVAGGGGVAYRYLVHQPRQGPATVEREPNNTPQQATRLTQGIPIAGKIGKRLGPQAADRDWYRLEIGGEATKALSATVSRIPNIDLCIEVYDRLGEMLARIDSNAKGVGETLTDLPVAPGVYYVLVREYWAKKDVVPTENITDSYRLEVRWRTPQEGWEREPNDSHKLAHKITKSGTVRGYLGRHDDVDTFSVVANKPMTLSVRMEGITGVDLVMDLWPARTKRKRTIDKQRVGKGEAFGPIVVGQKPLYFSIRRKNQRKGTTSGQALAGIGEAYALRVTMTPR